jgi:hypothetical protein
MMAVPQDSMRNKQPGLHQVLPIPLRTLAGMCPRRALKDLEHCSEVCYVTADREVLTTNKQWNNIMTDSKQSP